MGGMGIMLAKGRTGYLGGESKVELDVGLLGVCSNF
jgi:hypothetical protein